MKLLLDTHILLWMLYKQNSLSRHVRLALENEDNEFYISTQSLLELALKQRDGKLKIDVDFKTFIQTIERYRNLTILTVKPKHIVAYNDLTIHEMHRDPFDHIIIAQAIAEKLTVISDDHKFEFYIKQGLSLIEN